MGKESLDRNVEEEAKKLSYNVELWENFSEDERARGKCTKEEVDGSSISHKEWLDLPQIWRPSVRITL